MFKKLCVREGDRTFDETKKSLGVPVRRMVLKLFKTIGGMFNHRFMKLFRFERKYFECNKGY